MKDLESDAELKIAGEELRLLPERAMFWPRRETLFVADIHIGKAAAFRASGHGIPRGTTTADLARLSNVLRRTDARRLVILGDLYHARAGQVDSTMSVLRKWREEHTLVDVAVVRGNHDTRSNPSPVDLRFEELGPCATELPFVLKHHPESSDDGYVLAGHIHPGFTLRGVGGEKMRLPCFHVGSTMAVLPAFGSFTGLAAITPARNDRVFIIAEEAVFEVRPPR